MSYIQFDYWKFAWKEIWRARNTINNGSADDSWFDTPTVFMGWSQIQHSEQPPEW